MKLKRNGFWIFALVIFTAVMLYAVAAAWQRLGAGQEYPYLLKGMMLLLLVGGTLGLLLFCAVWTRLHMPQRLAKRPRLCRIAEWLAAAVVLCLSAWVRVAYVTSMPMQPLSDFKTYYEIADLLAHGTLTTEGIGYCDYIAMFPHVMGYPAFLSVFFRLFGSSVLLALGLNVVLSLGTAFVLWRVARRLAGRIGGFFTLCAAAFWPSQILFNNFVAGEFLFTFLLCCCLWLFLAQLQDYGENARHPWGCIGLLAAFGALLALTGAVRPMALLLLISALICLVPCGFALPARLLNDIPLGTRVIAFGWKRCLVVLAVYLACSQFLTLGVAYTADRELAGGGTSFGYNLLVGLNTETYGGWNQEDADLLYDSFDATGSANEAHLACRDLAIQRLKTDPRALLNLFIHKFEVLWGNDDYGASWNILFMDQQGNLTPAREAFYYRLMDFCDLFYLSLLLLAGVAALSFWRKGPDGAYVLMLLFLGTVAMHLVVENQNRYHFHCLALLAVFGGIAISYAMQQCRAAVDAAAAQKERAAEAAAARAEHLAALKAEETRLEALRTEAMRARFDLAEALREGHVNIVVSEAVRKPPAPTPKDPKGPKDPKVQTTGGRAEK